MPDQIDELTPRQLHNALQGRNEQNAKLLEEHYKLMMDAARSNAFWTMSAWTKVKPTDMPNFPWERKAHGQPSREDIIRHIKERKQKEANGNK